MLSIDELNRLVNLYILHDKDISSMNIEDDYKKVLHIYEKYYNLIETVIETDIIDSYNDKFYKSSIDDKFIYKVSLIDNTIILNYDICINYNREYINYILPQAFDFFSFIISKFSTNRFIGFQIFMI